jgi:hypothetical protein
MFYHSGRLQHNGSKSRLGCGAQSENDVSFPLKFEQINESKQQRNHFTA